MTERPRSMETMDGINLATLTVLFGVDECNGTITSYCPASWAIARDGSRHRRWCAIYQITREPIPFPFGERQNAARFADEQRRQAARTERIRKATYVATGVARDDLDDEHALGILIAFMAKGEEPVSFGQRLDKSGFDVSTYTRSIHRPDLLDAVCAFILKSTDPVVKIAPSPASGVDNREAPR